MNCGKSQEWFRHAASAWAEAELGITHIGKMDTDAYLDVGILIPTLTGFAAGCPNAFGGRSWTCEKGAFCPPAGCGLPVGDDFLAYKSKDPGCWSYMQGGFYFMSVQMAREVSQPGGWWAQQSGQFRPEDCVTGNAVYNWAKDSGSCVSAIDLKGMGAIWHPDDNGKWEHSFWYPPYKHPA
uniref:Hexosyltransferase n=1 Tax=Alexandrium catenella TaxID=2925 RepID=A0A7S1M0N9_ALECA|mmetsp:Transcript_16112/g.43796  ORF Transcript_16112/g.43796 Transcript_16112/m.43796 type:complete len:181 (+) Transcript_16112:3-545(+)